MSALGTPWFVGGATLAIGLVAGWLIRHYTAARQEARDRSDADERFLATFAELDSTRREAIELRNQAADLSAQLAEHDTTLATLRAQMADQHAVADRFRAERDAIGAKLEQLEATFERQSAEATATASAIATERDQLADRLAIADERLAKALDATRAERAILTTELIDHRRRAATAAETAEKLAGERDALERERQRLAAEVARREAEVRVTVVAQQAAFAEFRSELGALGAKAERAEVLRAQLDDRENLLRAVVVERDTAARTILAKDSEIDRLRTELGRERAVSAKAADRDADANRRVADLEARLAIALRERDALETASTRGAREIETLREEIRERDVRFRALLEDRRAAVEAGLAEMARLRREIDRIAQTTRVGPDDVKRISGVGPALERQLREVGVVSLRQIAEWTEDDIEQISVQLGAFRDRIRRDRWVEQARAIVSGAGNPAEVVG